jgi:hypothetical protein
MIFTFNYGWPIKSSIKLKQKINILLQKI